VVEQSSFVEPETVLTVSEKKCNMMEWLLKRFTVDCLNASAMVQCLASNMENAWHLSQPMLQHEVLTLKVSTA
jgi:hypothetical protein